MHGSILWALFLLTNLSNSHQAEQKKTSGRSFVIDYENDAFLKDDLPFRYISGSIHYFRVPPSDWRDRLKKLRYAGCNAVETYIEWASHEPEPGILNFEGASDVFNFLNIALEEDLLVILRPGPYIDAERDMGGLPYWLLRENPLMNLRTLDPSYLSYVDRFYSILFPLLRPFLYQNGGPIISVQIENEYGSYPACDFYYTTHLRNLTRSLLGQDIVLFTTDGDSTNFLKCGKVADVYASVDFGTGSDVEAAFAAQRIFEPRGPLINSEFYSGWLDHWGEPHQKVSPEAVARTLDKILAMNASVNIYMFHGGTSFGMTAGSNLGGSFQACPTSYDYDAPISEAGDLTDKYFAIRDIVQKYAPLPPGPLPGPTPKYSYGGVRLKRKGGVLQMKPLLPFLRNSWPVTFEALSVPNGIVLYTTKIPYMIPDPAYLSIPEIHDRGYVYLDEEFAGIVSRELQLYDLLISAYPNQTLTIVAESQGRICFGDQINDFKGITTNVTLGSENLRDWKMTPLPLMNSSQIHYAMDYLSQKNLAQVNGTTRGAMAFYEGFFNIPDDPSHPQNTFLRLDGWRKGYAWINDFLLGRYWPVEGPQVTVFVPWSVLKNGVNSILILELEEAPCWTGSCQVTLVDTPLIDGPTPAW